MCSLVKNFLHRVVQCAVYCKVQCTVQCAVQCAVQCSAVLCPLQCAIQYAVQSSAQCLVQLNVQSIVQCGVQCSVQCAVQSAVQCAMCSAVCSAVHPFSHRPAVGYIPGFRGAPPTILLYSTDYTAHWTLRVSKNPRTHKHISMLNFLKSVQNFNFRTRNLHNRKLFIFWHHFTKFFF